MRVVLVAAVTSFAVIGAAGAQPPANVVSALAGVSERVAAYVSLAKQLTEDLPPLKRTDDPAEIALREVALGAAIRTGRAGAKPGDVFTADAARVFRRVIKRDFRERPRGGQRVMLDEMPHFHPMVNQSYPSAWPLATFPATLLAVLPALPEGLEYRLLSEALILRDVNANIIVDFTLDIF